MDDFIETETWLNRPRCQLLLLKDYKEFISADILPGGEEVLGLLKRNQVSEKSLNFFPDPERRLVVLDLTFSYGKTGCDLCTEY